MRRVWAAMAACAVFPITPYAAAQDIACAVPAHVDAPATPESARELRRFATGADVRVAVIDTGVAPSPELDQVVPGADFVVSGAPDPLHDCDAHGTVVAGTIAGNTAGIAPDAEVIAIRQTSAHFRSAEPAGSGSLQTLTGAIHNALDLGAHVINISVVSCVDPRVAPRVDVAGLDAALGRAEAEGAVVVAAAGNLTGDCPQGSHVFPSHSSTVLAVGSRSDPHTVADYSIRVPAGSLQLSAAGRVAAAPSPDGNGWAGGTVNEKGDVFPFEGTSFAAPVVTGAVALLKQRRPDLTPARVREIVAASAEPSGGAIDPLAVATQLAPDALEHTDRMVVGPARGHTSAAPGRWLKFASALAVFVLVIVVGSALRPRAA
ncbi:S8 family serine peptidase [Corynebacterium qintianiae]|uniref:S8 family serine peptidase n=1 Tax=Corynebacterium qintianiae TaxID=2709392 RepID=UPI002017931B|nr:S8 family serine peptidase [Corynebacterium qintianiae]